MAAVIYIIEITETEEQPNIELLRRFMHSAPIRYAFLPSQAKRNISPYFFVVVVVDDRIRTCEVGIQRRKNKKKIRKKLPGTEILQYTQYTHSIRTYNKNSTLN